MNNAFESIQKGLMEAIEFSEGNTKAATMHTFDAVDVKEVRHNQAIALTIRSSLIQNSQISWHHSNDHTQGTECFL